MMQLRNIEIKSIMSLTIDGAPTKLARGKGTVRQLVKDNFYLINYCIIYQTVLCVNLCANQYGDVIETIMTHFNDLNAKLQENRTIFNLITAIRAFQKKLEISKHNIQLNFIHFPSLLEQGKGKKDDRYEQFFDKLTNNFAVRISDLLWENFYCCSLKTLF